jgi:hypothetical protein
MPRGASPKRERQYEHIKKSERRRGESPERATEIAARTVNKERARSGEARSASKTSTQDISLTPPRRPAVTFGPRRPDQATAVRRGRQAQQPAPIEG